ncbi:uncharacterized protein si:dkey-13n15.2 [Cololabis saira]|uniref:uncharacterized protein si:dkey-13n15.2 n=1 Tax=Cololabis saira TaxID=129043 RepID=UPI002AD27C0E|nr:uncharacterized protein si:dkey-13n15.2 [Cololabis saira]
MMDNSTANENHISCQPWAGQSGWPTPSSQGLLVNPHANAQHLSLGSSSDHRPLYNHLQASNQSISNLSGFPPRSSSHHAALDKAPHINSIPSSNSLFDSTAIQDASHLLSFAQQNPHTSSMLIAGNQVEVTPQPPLPQQNQGPPPCRPPYLDRLSSHNPHKALFQTQLPNQRLSDGLQDLSICLSSCRHAAFGGQGVDSTAMAGYGHSFSSSTSQEPPQWGPSLHSRAAVNEPVLNAGVHTNDGASENGGTVTKVTDNEKLRSVIIQQRAHLLQQLENMNKLLESLPPDNNSDGPSPPDTPAQDDSPPCQGTESTDAPQAQLSPEESHHSDCSFPSAYGELRSMCDTSEPRSAADSPKRENQSGDEDPDYKPESDDDGASAADSDSTCPSESLSPGNATPPLTEIKQEHSEDSSCDETGESPPKKTQETKSKKLFETVVMPSSSTKERRVYDKKNYCLFCSKPVFKIARHMEAVHSDREEVAVAFQHPLLSPERQKIWNNLKKEGNFAHNKKVWKTGEGQLVFQKRPRLPMKVKDYVHCEYCHGLYVNKALFRHMKMCSERSPEDEEPHLRKKRMVSRCALLAVNCEALGISADIKNILGDMVYDDVTRSIMDDRIILQFAEQMFNEYDRDMKKSHYIRQNLRQIARLVLEAQAGSPLQSLQDFFHPSNFKHVVATVKGVSGYDAETKTFSRPSLAIKLGYNLQKICKIVEGNAAESGDAAATESARSFLSMYRLRWNKLISVRALRNLREVKQKRNGQVPLAEDVKRLHFHMENVLQLAERRLREKRSTENYAELARVLLARTIFFNRRKTSEVTSIPITAFAARRKAGALDEVGISVSKLERTLCGFFTRIVVRGACGKSVPVLLKPSFESAMELLIDAREACGVSGQNPYVFGRPSALSAYSGSESIQKYVKECGAKNPAALKSQQIKRHFATLLQLINLDKDEARRIFGPDNQIQMLQQNDGTTCDADVESGVRIKCVKAEEDGSADDREDDKEKTTSRRADRSRRKGFRPNSKLKWDDAEVRAVERHLMRFITEHKVPQKKDCVKCLEAEPRALKSRSWQGVKNYVRNRITTLQRQRRLSKDSSETNAVKSQQSTSREAAAGRHGDVSDGSGGAADTHEEQACGGTTSCVTARPPRADRSSKDGSGPKSKLKWHDAEVRAVERHMMRFIKDHKVPQKSDCMQCLAAEPGALKSRSWKGVKDYVRNRITTLQRQQRLSKTSLKHKKRSRPEEPWQDAAHFQQLYLFDKVCPSILANYVSGRDMQILQKEDKMMDAPSSNLSQPPHHAWAVQNGWSTATPQSPVCPDPLPSFRHLNMGSSPDQTSFYSTWSQSDRAAFQPMVPVAAGGQGRIGPPCSFPLVNNMTPPFSSQQHSPYPPPCPYEAAASPYSPPHAYQGLLDGPRSPHQGHPSLRPPLMGRGPASDGRKDDHSPSNSTIQQQPPSTLLTHSTGTMNHFVPNAVTQDKHLKEQSSTSESRYGLDPELLPSAVKVMDEDWAEWEGRVFVSEPFSCLPPLSTTSCVIEDKGNASPCVIRSTSYSIPCDGQMALLSRLPLGALVTPLGKQHAGEKDLPLCKDTDCLLGCGCCGAPMCPAMAWQDCGQRFSCPFCEKLTEVPWKHFQPTRGVEGDRVDKDERPELSLGSYEITASQKGESPALLLAVDVSASALRSGHLEFVTQQIHALFTSLNGEDGESLSDVPVGLMTYDSRIHLYDLSPNLSRPHMLVVTETEDLQLPLREGLLVPLKDCVESIDSVLRLLPQFDAEFEDSRGVPIELPVKAGLAVLQGLRHPGKLLIFHTSALIEAGHSNFSSGFFVPNRPMSIFQPPEQAVLLAKECVRQGCGVHLFVLSQPDVGGAWPGHIPHLSGGALHTYSHLQGALDRERFSADLKRTVNIETCYQAELRIFVSKDLRVSGCYGLFVPGPSPGHVTMATLDSRTTLAVELAHTRALDETRGAAIQVVLCYSNQAGERRTRVHTLTLRCSRHIQDMFRSCQAQTLLTFYCKKMYCAVLERPLQELREELQTEVTEALASYRKHCCSSSVSAGQLVLPQHLRTLPVYINSLRKSEVLLPGLRSSVHQRLQQRCRVLGLDTASTVTHFYPRLLSLLLSGGAGGHLRCCAASLEPRGLYLVDAPLALLLWVGIQVPACTLVELFNTSCFSSLPSGETKLPALENRRSVAVRALIDALNVQAPGTRKLLVVKQGDSCEEALQRHLVEDKSPNGGASYADFLYHVHVNSIRLLQ